MPEWQYGATILPKVAAVSARRASYRRMSKIQAALRLTVWPVDPSTNHRCASGTGRVRVSRERTIASGAEAGVQPTTREQEG